ncbi:sulfite exporter TauE/SafE family protein [bacterium]|nr:sulfite exporter TauE/SafE family protein [bacterium]
MDIFTGFALGIFGSFHCVGMCGPLALALPHAGSSRIEMISGSLLYNAGRTVTYALMGVLMGALGATAKFAGYQQALSVGTGLILLMSVLLPAHIKNKIFFSSPLNLGFSAMKGFFKKFLSRHSYTSLFSIGLVNGLLPCGLVYIALAGAIVTSDIFYGAVYMGLFGVGTLPMMLFISFAGRLMTLNFRQKLVHIMPVGVAVISFLLILRGLALGIPYVSPRIDNNQGIQHIECCH